MCHPVHCLSLFAVIGERVGGSARQQSPAARQSTIRVPAEKELQGSVLRDAGEDPEVLREQVYS